MWHHHIHTAWDDIWMYMDTPLSPQRPKWSFHHGAQDGVPHFSLGWSSRAFELRKMRRVAHRVWKPKQKVTMGKLDHLGSPRRITLRNRTSPTLNWTSPLLQVSGRMNNGTMRRLRISKGPIVKPSRNLGPRLLRALRCHCIITNHKELVVTISQLSQNGNATYPKTN